MTLFTRIFNDLGITRRIWDFYFLDGIFVLFQTAIALLRILSEINPALWGEMEDILPALQNAGAEILNKIGSPEEVEQLLVGRVALSKVRLAGGLAQIELFLRSVVVQFKCHFFYDGQLGFLHLL